MSTVETRSEGNQISVRVEWSRFDKVTIKFTTILTIMGVQYPTVEFIDRRALKQFKALTGNIGQRCAQLADQKTQAVTESLKQRLALITQSRHVIPEVH